MRALVLMLALAVGCSSPSGAPDGGGVADSPAADTATEDVGAVDAPATDTGTPARGVVHVVLFTHIEDSTPAGMIGSSMNRMAYLRLRSVLIDMAELAQRYDLPWVLQPDWAYLEAALVYETDATITADTGGTGLFVYLRDTLGVVIDPHSHENGGYDYTDVAHELELLGVGGSTVIGGHIWDPSLAQFQMWDRFRVPVMGEHYPTAFWRGDILIGAGTPMHVNDPLVSGVWRPQDRDHFFVDDPAGNIVAVGAWENDVAGVMQLVGLYEDGTVPPDQLLTASWNIQPSVLTATDGIATVETTVMMPMASLRDAGSVEVTDFTTLVETWRSDYGARASLYMPP